MQTATRTTSHNAAHRRQVAQYDAQGRKLGEYESLSDAKKATGVGTGNISNAAHNPTRKSGGFFWRISDGTAPDFIDVPTDRKTRFSARPVVQFDTLGNKVAEFASSDAATKATGMHACSIRKCANHQTGYRTVGGYCWVWADSPEYLFREYRQTGDVTIRNRLMESNLPLVRVVAEKLHATLPPEVQVDELISAGTFGLIDAINGFEPERGFKFGTYAGRRIRGSMLDWIRNRDWVPRLVRSRGRKLAQAVEQLRHECGREPDRHEVAGRVALLGGDFAKIEADAVGMPQTVSLSRKYFESDSRRDIREIDVLPDRRSVKPGERAEREDLKDFILRGLDRTERMIVTLYYYEEMTMREIGRVVDLSESRVSQMHSTILQRLKAREHLQDLLDGRAA